MTDPKILAEAVAAAVKAAEQQQAEEQRAQAEFLTGLLFGDDKETGDAKSD